MANIINIFLGGSSKKETCCGVEIKEVKSDETCCAKDVTPIDGACCDTEKTQETTSCCG